MGDSVESAGLQPSVFRTTAGLEILHYNKAETTFAYKEIFEDRTYLRHGIALEAGSTVVDLGANIGLFTVFVQELFPGGRVLAVEPCPPTFGLLTANTERYGTLVSRAQCGVSSEESEAVLTHYPDYSILSGFHVDAAANVQTVKAGIRNQWAAKFPNRAAMDEQMVEAVAQNVLGKKQSYRCRLRPLSSLLSEFAVEKIDLLKIDTEGSELQVLSGIAEGDWPRVAQIVIEIHDARSLAGAVLQLLQGKGFVCVVEEEAALRASGIVNCYARRG